MSDWFDTVFDVFLAAFFGMVLLALAGTLGALVWVEWQEIRAKPCVCAKVEP